MARKNKKRTPNVKIDFDRSYNFVKTRIQNKVRRVNSRISALEKLPFDTPELEILKSQIGGNRLRLGRKPSLDVLKQIDFIASKFLGNPYTMVKNAKERENYHKTNFDNLIQKLSPNASQGLKDVLYNHLGSVDFGELTKYYEYEEVVSMAIRVENIQIKPTTENLKYALKNGIYRYIQQELKRRGVRLSLLARYSDEYQLMNEYVHEVLDKGDINAGLNKYKDTIRKFQQ